MHRKYQEEGIAQMYMKSQKNGRLRLKIMMELTMRLLNSIPATTKGVTPAKTTTQHTLIVSLLVWKLYMIILRLGAEERDVPIAPAQICQVRSGGAD